MVGVRDVVRRAKRARRNRAYYDKYLDVEQLASAGILQDPAKAALDLVQLGEGERNELVLLFGFDQKTSAHFQLELSVVSLCDEWRFQKTARWRLAKVALVVQSAAGTRFSYEHEQLLDYDAKRAAARNHENSNIHQVGSLTLETVSPFSLSRVFFVGLMRVESESGGPDGQAQQAARFRPMRLAISTHPTCDKFDYQFRFGSDYCARTVGKQPRGDPARLLELMLEDRFDQPLMFQGRLESLDPGRPLAESLLMWGAKVKKFLAADRELAKPAEADVARDCLFVWAECGHQIHLSRPKMFPDLVNGLAHNSFDYASHLYGAALSADGVAGAEFSELGSFAELTAGHVIMVDAFKGRRRYRIGFQPEPGADKRGPMRAHINGFDGWALCKTMDLGRLIRDGQDKLLSLAIDDRLLGPRLNSECLLGGKASSLVGLSADLSVGIRQDRLGAACRVSVPRGLVVTSGAYNLWLRSDCRIRDALKTLDNARRELASRSATELNPLARTYVAPGERQHRLQLLCREAGRQLTRVPLPEESRRQLRDHLVETFGEAALDDQTGLVFAVRSSAVGEDSLDTSAAGQMRTILDARGFDRVCRAVVECWASQFELEAVTYKSQNGLQFNLPMAVVIQELVACRVAGVAATCDPLTGDKSRLTITANAGQGEGVVAGKAADWVVVSLGHLRWDARLDEYAGQRLALGQPGLKIEKTSAQPAAGCCLSDAQIVALANLLLEIRQSSELREREVEWGITWAEPQSGASSSSSSSCSSALEADFEVHLFQSRPLTNLRRLSAREIDHELDWGVASPLDLCSRANLGEVMPGALCPLNQTWFMPVATSNLQRRPDLDRYSRSQFSMNWAGFHANLAVSVQTNCLTMLHSYSSDPKERELQHAVNYTMVGSTFEVPAQLMEPAKFEQFLEEKRHPMLAPYSTGPGLVLALDTGLAQAAELAARLAARTDLLEGLESLDRLREALERRDTEEIIRGQIGELFGRLSNRLQPFRRAWLYHMIASGASAGFNMIAVQLLAGQPANEGKSLTDNELLTDFSVLLREPEAARLGDQTESGDISRLIDGLVEYAADTRQLDGMRRMDPGQLFRLLAEPDGQDRTLCELKLQKLFASFIRRNGHRAAKEFCLSTKTWAEDPSYVMRLLAARIKAHSAEGAERQRAAKLASAGQHEAELARVTGQVTKNRLVLLNYALPRARNATKRREKSKSLLVKMVHKYRLAFRHLGGLLCLAGLLPSAELVFFLTIEELREVTRCCAPDAAHRWPRATVMPRLLYKARRRQQRYRTFDQVTFPRPALSVAEMVHSIAAQTRPRDAPAAAGDPCPVEQAPGERCEVRGITSCAGRVTGRACVISSPDDVDQLQPDDILVTYSIDISWSVYFFMLAGIVTEVGGIVSHGAVVAREYGLPTLCTAVGACGRFRTGQRITLDASRGVCYLDEPEQVCAPGAPAEG